MYRCLLSHSSLLCKFSLISLLSSSVSQAEVTFDNSVGQTSTPNTLRGEMIIPEQRGTLNGNNLFHSFQDFNINTGESATFTGQSPVENIIGRVTGGNASLIDGQLSTRFENSNPNLYLMNPNGVLFGPNARLDVQGSFHVTTADYLRLGNQALFYADLGKNTTFSMAPVEAFGFTDAEVGMITINQSDLRVPKGETLSIYGGDIHYQGATGTALVAESGRINLASVASAGEIFPDSHDLDVSAFDALGQIEISEGAELWVDSLDSSAGTIYIRGYQLVLDDGSLFASTFSNAPATSIDIALTGDLQMSNNSKMEAGTFSGSSGNAGDIQIRAANINMSNSEISTNTNGSGDAGDISIQAEQLIVDGNESISFISASAQQNSEGKAGNILLDSETIILQNTAFIVADSDNQQSAGLIDIQTGSLTVRDRASLSVSARASGQAGRIQIDASETISLIADRNEGRFANLNAWGPNGAITIRSSSLLVDSGIIWSSSSGQIMLNVDRLQLINGGNISAIALIAINQEPAGSITVNATESVRVDGSVWIIDDDGKATESRSQISTTTDSKNNAADIHINSPQVTVDRGWITADSQGSGQGGDVHLSIDRLVISNGGSIDTRSLKNGSGDAGDIDITAHESVMIIGNESISSGIEASTVDGGGLAGNIEIQTPQLFMDEGDVRSVTYGDKQAGNIKLTVDDLVMRNETFITASTSGSGQGGNITINADSLVLDEGRELNGNDQPYIGILAVASSSGQAGNIILNVEQLEVHAGALITADTHGPSRGGNISINADRILLDGGPKKLLNENGQRVAGIIANTNSESHHADAGHVTIYARQIEVRSGAEIGTNTFGSGKGGELTITAETVHLDGAGISGFTGIAAATQRGMGDAGNLTLNVQQLEVLNGAQVATSGDLGEAGSLTITADNILLTGIDHNGFSSGLFVSTSGVGNAGDLTLTSQTLTISEGAKISASTESAGRGGQLNIQTQALELSHGGLITATSHSQELNAGDSGGITLMTDTLQLSNGSRITVETEQAHAGDITLNIGSLLQLNDNSAITTSLAARNNQGTGNGGNININTDPHATDEQLTFAILDDTSRIIAQAQQGNGGEINIGANTVLFRAPGTVINASSRSGHNGQITIDSPDTNLIESTLMLSDTFLDASELLNQRCADRNGKRKGRFIIKSLGEIQENPEDYLSGFYTTADNGGQTISEQKDLLLNGSLHNDLKSVSSFDCVR